MGTNTLAVEIHQRSRASLDISLDLRLDGHTEPIAARGPFLQDAQPTSVRVRWRGVPASDGRVRYGTSPANLTSSMLDPTVAEDHEVLLPGLTPETRYYYAVGSSAMDLAGGDSEHFFETPPTVGSSTPLRFWVLGDSGTANRDARDVRDAYESFTGATYTNAIVLLGDNAYERSGEEELQTAVFDMYGDALRQSPAYPTRGNHEAVAAVYFDAYTMPAGGVPSGTEAYYSFDYGNVHFLCLDSQGSDRAVDGPMWLWARDDLTATDQPWIVAFWHHPPYSKGNHDSDTEASLVQMRENFLPLLEDHAVDLVLGGHSHSYERSFLVDGHYGDSTTLTNNMRVDDGDGRPDGDGAYNKAAGPRAGAVYITAGSSGKITNAAFGHPIMVHSRALLGSVVLDVDGGRMDVKFLDAQGLVDDSFTMLGEDYVGVYCVASVNSYGCTADVTTLGTPSVSSPSAFTLTASNLPPKSFAFLVYSTAPENTPGLFGRVCVDRPLRRRLATFTQGPAPCGGRAEIDFNETIQAGFDPGLVVGTTIYSQFWYRDRLPQGAAVSEAYQFTIQP
ncbi:MAG: metallophosphoesterase family protein [bacterium]|nr:metallophosphoesterase family protein [bacterium]